MGDWKRVVTGLQCCATKEHCHFGGCPYYFPENPDDCTSRLARQALEFIRNPDEPTKFQIKSAISNAEKPAGIDEEQFFVVMSNISFALAKLYKEPIKEYVASGGEDHVP